MALQYKDLVTLAKTVLKADTSAPVAYSFNGNNYSRDDLRETLKNEIRELSGSYRLYRENKNIIFNLMEDAINEVFPQRVMKAYSMFAEMKTFKQGDKPIFTQKITAASRRRAHQFIGKVGLNGLYEIFKLDGQSFEVPTDAIGGAASVGWEEFLDGRVDLADVLDILLEGLDECIYMEIEKQLHGAAARVQGANKVSGGGFNENQMDRLIGIAESYGSKAVIYCTFDFAAKMVPSTGWVSDEMRNERWDNGYLGNYKGHQVIVLPNSYEDTTNKVQVIDPSYAYIIPSGAEKPVKIAFEGDAIANEIQNYDHTSEIHIYKKVGVRAIFSTDICIYQNTDLSRVRYTGP